MPRTKSEISANSRSVRSYAPVWTIMGIGIVLAVTVFYLIRQGEYQTIRTQFQTDAGERSSIISREIEWDFDVLRDLQSLAVHYPEQARGHLLEYMKHEMQHHSGIVMLAWIPRSSYSAPEGDDYVPVELSGPLVAGEMAEGFDLASVPELLKAIPTAGSMGNVMAVQYPASKQHGDMHHKCVIIMPVYRDELLPASVSARREKLAGFVVGIFRFDRIVENSFRSLQSEGIDFHIYDISAAKADHLLYSYKAGTETNGAPYVQGLGDKKSVIKTSLKLPMADRTLSVVFEAMPEYLAHANDWHAWGGAAGILLLSIIIAYYHGSTLNRMSMVRENAEMLKREISERNAAEAEWKNTFDSISDYVSIIDTDSRIVKVNKALAGFASSSPEELVGRHCYEVFHGIHKPISDCPHMTMMQEKQPVTREIYDPKRGLHYMVSVSPFYDNGVLKGSVHLVKDITEKKRIEEEIRRNFSLQKVLNEMLALSIEDILLEELLDKTIELVLSVPWLALEASGSIHLVDEDTGLLVMKAQRGLPESVEKTCGSIPFDKCLCGRAAGSGRVVFADCINDEHEISYDGMKPHGHYCVPIILDGRSVGVMNMYLREGHIRDEKEEAFLTSVAQALAGIIARIQGEEERERLQKQLLHAQKMETVGRMAGGIAHDFNNILTAITSYSYLIKKSLGEDSEPASNAQKILLLAERAANISRGLLSFSRKQYFDMAPVSLNRIVCDSEKLLTKLITEKIKYRTDLSDRDLVIKADATRIEQVLMNLVVNAGDAMPEGGDLVIKTGLMEMSESFVRHHGFGTPGTYAMLSVSDSGTGLSEEIGEKIFEPFFTTKETGKGTGLGLSIVYGIVRQHSGYIDYRSEPGKGTEFIAYLPAAAMEVEVCRPKPACSLAAGNKTILIAEDEPEVRDSLKKILEINKYRVIEAEDGKEAVYKFSENYNSIDLVILDLVMPVLDGKETFENICSIAPGVKVIFISGYGADVLQSGIDNERKFAVISKPIMPDMLLMNIRDLLAGT